MHAKPVGKPDTTLIFGRARITPKNAHRCEQPGQQHGRRIPSLSSEHTLSTCCLLVSSFLTEMVQQIHSLRASGVMSSQAASAFASDASPCLRSAGSLCTAPPEIRTVAIELSHRLKDQASDTRVQLGFPDYRDDNSWTITRLRESELNMRQRAVLGLPFAMSAVAMTANRLPGPFLTPAVPRSFASAPSDDCWAAIYPIP